MTPFQSLLACTVLAVVLSAPALAAQGDRVRLRGEDCHDASGELITSLEENWRYWHQWPHFIQICPLYNPNGQVVFYLLTLRFDKFDELGVPESVLTPKLPTERVPSPRLFDVRGLVLGQLPKNFPGDIPGEFHVTFTDWHDQFPWRIEMRIINWAVSGTRDLEPMTWNPAKYRYEEPCRRVQKVP